MSLTARDIIISLNTAHGKNSTESTQGPQIKGLNSSHDILSDEMSHRISTIFALGPIRDDIRLQLQRNDQTSIVKLSTLGEKNN